MPLVTCLKLHTRRSRRTRRVLSPEETGAKEADSIKTDLLICMSATISVGSKSNRIAFGARIKVAAGDLVQTAERRGGGSYLSQNDTRLHFGLEKRAKIDYVGVRWSGGAVEKLMNVPVNTFILIKEGEGSWRAVIRSESQPR
jgi:ASPIC and UnbV